MVNVPLSNATLNTLQGTYFDDYNEDKKFYRILFRPAVAVQARELTQLQTILQKQVSRLGDHVFQEGSVVNGCAPKQFSATPFIRVVDSFLSNTIAIATVEDLDDTYMITNGKNSNTAVRAKIFLAKKGFQSNYPDTNRFYVQYIYTGKDGSNNDVGSFANGETLYIYSANQTPLATLSNTNIIASINVFTTNTTANAASGNGFIVSVGDGIIFQKGFFQKVDKQYAIVNNYSSVAGSTVVGFETVESIVTEYQDTSLNDNANGSSNYNAPGAHRLKLTPTLVVKTKTEVSNNFFAVIEFDGNTAVQLSSSPMYEALGEVLAKRTQEESGDYTISPFAVETTANTSDANSYNYEISPGVSYIKGSRVELVGTRRVLGYRANTTQIAQNKVITANYGNYVYCKEVLGAANFDTLGEVALYDTAFTAITDREGLSGGTSGNIVGYANIKTVTYYSGTRGSSDCQYYVYLFNIRMNAGKAFSSDVKSIYLASGAYGKFKADLILESNAAVLYDATFTPMLFTTGYSAVKSLSAPIRDTSFYYRKTTSSTLNGNGFMSFTLSGGLGAAGAEQLYDTDSRDYIVSIGANAYSANVTGTVSLYSTVNSTASNSTATFVVGTTTTFESSFKVGDTIRISNTTAGSPAFYKVAGISSNTSMYVTPAATANSVANTYQRYYQDGSILNLTDSMLSVNATSNTFTISTGITFDSGSGSTVYAQYPVVKSPAVQTAKTVSKNRLVKIDCSNNTANSVGPWTLGLPDVVKINNIWVGSSSTYANTTANRSVWFTLDNGQRDDKYDLATLSVKPTYKNNITATSTILVDLDHLVTDTSSGIGYYSIDSYPVYTDGINSNSTTIALADIPVYNSKTNGTRYDLRNAIDFRPIKTATANSIANTNYANTLITINPASANSNTFNISGYGQYHPEVDSQFIADYEYYLPRYDLILLGPIGQASVANGVAEVNPKKPLNVSDASVIAEAYIPPFPSLTTREAEIANRPDMATKIFLRSNKRYTMRDIGVLEERIARLEYYTVLSTLEKAAKDLSVPDATGKDRFKNGIFADPFNSHTLGNPSSTEYKISVDPVNSIARPDYQNHLIDFKYNSSNSTNVVQKGPYIMLAYNQEKFASQKFATKYRNCTESIWSWKGSAILAPSQDTFTDETTAPAIMNTINLAKPFQDLAAGGFLNTKIYGSQSSTTTVDQKISIAVGGGGTTTTTDTTSTTVTNQNVSQLNITPTTTNYNLGTFVKDVSVVPYMRSTDVAFFARAMKPNTKLHVFFDGVNVDAYITPGVLTTDPKNFTYDAKEKTIVTANAPKGVTGSNPLVANSTGGVAGIFTIPAGKFRTGDRKLLITNVDDLVTGANARITSAEAIYTASGIAVTKQNSTLTTINPNMVITSSVETNTVVTKKHVVDFVPDPVPDGGGGGGDGSGGSSCFVAGSSVTLADGSCINIEDVKIGDRLKGFASINTVLGFDHPKIESRKIYGFNGKGRFVTAEHPLKTLDGWKSLSPEATHAEKPSLDYLNITKLEIGDWLITETGIEQIESIEEYSDQNPDELLYNFVLDGDNTYYVNGILAHNKDPIAQSFNIPVPNDVAGQFISKIEVSFRSKDPVNGIACWLLQMTNGAPDFSKILGISHLSSAEITTSADSTGLTTFEFEWPVYISADSDYAFMLQPDGDSPEYEVWTAETGGFDIGDYPGSQVYKNPYEGVMFISSNKKSWTMIQTEDIKFNLYRCRFTQTSGSAVFNNESDEYLTLTGVVKANTRSIAVGDVVYSTNTSKIANTSGPFGIIQSYDENTGQMILDSANSGFSNAVGSEMIQIHRIQPNDGSNTSITTGNTASSNLLTSTIIAYANVATVDNYKYHTITPKYAVMVPQATGLNFSYKGTDTSYNADSSWKSIVNDGMNEQFDKERIVMSFSNEASALSGNKSAFFKADFNTASTLVSPVIDLRRKSSYFIENLINNDLTNEQYTYGNALSKYISKRVVLADGQDAEDLRVTLTAFRPINSDIAVYAKFQNAGDIESFDTKLWTPLSYINAGDVVYSSSGALNDYVEYDFGIPAGTSTTFNFNANTGVTNASDFISITNNTFVNNQIVYYYTAVGNTVISGLSNATYYYAVSANSTGLKLSASQGGANINITASSTVETGHYLRGYVSANIAHTAFTNPDNSSIVEYYDNSNSRWTGYKYFAIKIVLTSTDRVNYPRLNDVRAIALQI
jgi:hypothetical protein